MNRRLLYILFLIIILAFTLFEELKLRPYLFKNHITKFGLADSLPNFLASLIFIFAAMVLFQPQENIKVLRISISTVIGLVLYEFFQLFMDKQVFDIKDIIASIMGGLFAYFLIIIINRLFPVKTV